MAVSETFEASMERLEKVLKELESDTLSLDKSIDKFEEGMALIKTCRASLLSARQRITKITEDGKETDFEGESS